MKKVIVLTFLYAMAFLSGFSQIHADKTDGGSVATKISGNNKLNELSTLKREKTTINDDSCPIKLHNLGIGTSHSMGLSSYFFYPYGTFKSKEPIVAFETNHVLYDVFGNYMHTLSNTVIKDIESSYAFTNEEKWEALENEAKTYFACVSYVTKVRTKNGVIWHCDTREIKSMPDSLYAPIGEDDTPEERSEDL